MNATASAHAPYSSRGATALLLLGALLWAGDAHAEVRVDYSVEVQNDTRVDVGRLYEAVPDTDGVGSKVVLGDDPTFSRNEAGVRLKVRVAPAPQVRFVGDVELIWTNLSDRHLSLRQLTDRSDIDPWRLECDAAYVDLRDIAPGLDIRIGRQIVQWGSADMFNPTNNINSDDLEDRAVFREPIANEMIRIDYFFLPDRSDWLSEMIFTFVWVPVFRPSQLPSSAVIALGDSSAPVPVLEDDVQQEISDQRAGMAELLEDPNTRTDQPEFSFNNSQFAFRIQTRMINTDFSLSYYRGFDDVPVMARADTVFTDEGTVGSDVTLVYPRMQAFGFDINGQIPWLDDMGFWVEGAVIFPERVGMVFSLPIAGGVDIEGTSIEDRPFLKLTAGIDYAFNANIFLNVQYVRGMINEFGASKLNNFLVIGFDLKFWSDRILLRLFTLLQLDFLSPRDPTESDEWWTPWREERLSANLFPMLRINPWGSIEADLGAIIPIGSEESFFGQPATGATTIFLRARAAF